MRLGLAVPLFNEAPLVEAVTRDLVAALEGIDFTLALVDNGSTDGTGELVDRMAGERVLAVHLRDNRGYGGGILAGLEALGEADVLGWAWGDGQVDPSVIPCLLAAIEGGAVLAKARRTRRQDGWRRRVLTTAYAGVMRLAGVSTPDVNGCPKLLRRDAFDALHLRATDWFLDAEAVLGAEARGWPIANEPVVMRSRPAGHSKVRAATVLEFAGHLVGRSARP